MKVLVLGLHGILGGSETYVYNLVRGLDKNKVKFDFLVVGNKKTPYEDDINIYYDDGLNHFFYCPDLKNDPKNSIKWMRTFYREHNYDLIYLNATSAANAIYCMFPVSLKKTPLITHSHFSNGPKRNHLMFRWYTNKHSVCKLACSKPAAHWMFGKDIQDVIYIANGIDTERFVFNSNARSKIRAGLNIKDDDILVGHVGRFSPEKNQKFLVELASTLPDRYKFICIGEGPTKEDVTKEMVSKGLEDRFFILPVKMNVNEYYSAMDVFAMPSFYEGLPIVTVEAQCAGLSIILSDSISKETDLTGFCYYKSVDDVSSWKECLNKLTFEKYDGEKFIEKAGFSNKKVANVIFDLFLRALNKES